MRTRNDLIVDRLEPFVVCPPWHRDRFDLAPFGLEIPAPNIIDPTRTDASGFLDRLALLDRLSFGRTGMEMPRWIFYECAEVPGGIFGFTCRTEQLDPVLRERLGLPERSTGLVPLSMYIAIPARPPAVWYGHNLASLNRLLPELGLRGLASITKGLALKVFRCGCQIGATQWDSPAIHVHVRFGAMELLTAWTPAHSEPGTLTYRLPIDDTVLRAAIGDPTASLRARVAEFEIVADDTAAMRRLQSRIEAAERFVVAGPPRYGPDDRISVPLAMAPEA